MTSRLTRPVQNAAAAAADPTHAQPPPPQLFVGEPDVAAGSVAAHGDELRMLAHEHNCVPVAAGVDLASQPLLQRQTVLERDVSQQVKLEAQRGHVGA